MEQNNEKIKKDKKFIKIYMLTLLGVAITLILASYFSQDKLNDEIDRLTSLVDTTEKEAVQSLNKVESLQKLTEEQGKAIGIQEKELEQLRQIDKKYQANEVFWQLQKEFYIENFNQVAILILQLEKNNQVEFLSDLAKTEYQAIKANKNVVEQIKIEQKKAMQEIDKGE